MRIGLLSDLTLPRPWTDDGDAVLITRELERIVLAEELGLASVWIQEHHFLEELAHGGGAVALLGAAAARTARIRLGLGLLSVEAGVRHPAVLAAELATLDQLSDGRLDVATGVARAGVEVAGLGLARQTARARWEHGTSVLARMLDERPFTGTPAPDPAAHDRNGAGPVVPPRLVSPRPRQRPHPPLWARCDKPAEIGTAARLGLAALCRAPLEPSEAAEWVAEYRAVLASDRCHPVTAAITPRVAVCLPMTVHADEATAVDRGIDGAHFLAYAAAHYERFGEHRPAGTDLWAEFLARRDDVGLARSAVIADGSSLTVRVFRDGRASQRGAVGTPAQVAELLGRYAAAGVDDVLLVLPPGDEDEVRESLRLFATEVLPGMPADPDPDPDPDPELETAIRGALVRRPAAPPLSGESIGALAEAPAATVAAPAVRPSAGPEANTVPEGTRGRLRQPMPSKLKERGTDAVRRAIARADDRWLERSLGSGRGLRFIFTQMASRFVPEAANGFVGVIAYELRDAAGAVRVWSVRVTPTSATASPGPVPEAALTIQLGLADFVRLAAGELDPARLLLGGRMELRGDFGLATRLGAMFGQ